MWSTCRCARVRSKSSPDSNPDDGHYHCLEPPRWLYEDVLHRRIDGRPKRPLWLTRLLFSGQRRRDQRLVKQLLQRPNASIFGNSMWIQRRLEAVYGISSDPTKENGEPPDETKPDGRWKPPT